MKIKDLIEDGEGVQMGGTYAPLQKDMGDIDHSPSFQDKSAADTKESLFNPPKQKGVNADKYLSQVKKDQSLVSKQLGIKVEVLAAEEKEEWLQISTPAGHYKVHSTAEKIDVKNNRNYHKITIDIYDNDGSSLVSSYTTVKPRYFSVDELIDLYFRAYLKAGAVKNKPADNMVNGQPGALAPLSPLKPGGNL